MKKIFKIFLIIFINFISFANNSYELWPIGDGVLLVVWGDDKRIEVSGEGKIDKDKFHDFLKKNQNKSYNSEEYTFEITNNKIKFPDNSSNLFKHPDNDVKAMKYKMIFPDNMDVSNVSNMRSMFSEANIEKLDMSNWNTNNVTDFSSMFAFSNLNHFDLSNIDTSNVTNMGSMFHGTKINKDSTNIDTSNWDTSKVTNMSSMFSFVDFTPDVTNWNTSNLENAVQMFSKSYIKNLDVSKWNTSKLKNATAMFEDLENEVDLNVSNWNTSNLEYSSSMFLGYKGKDLDVSNWNTSKLKQSSFMFAKYKGKNLDVSNWDTSNLEMSDSMFSDIEYANIDVSKWNTKNLTFIKNMFKNYLGDKIDICNWSIDKLDFSTISNDPNHEFIVYNEYVKKYFSKLSYEKFKNLNEKYILYKNLKTNPEKNKEELLKLENDVEIITFINARIDIDKNPIYFIREHCELPEISKYNNKEVINNQEHVLQKEGFFINTNLGKSNSNSIFYINSGYNFAINNNFKIGIFTEFDNEKNNNYSLGVISNYKGLNSFIRYRKAFYSKNVSNDNLDLYVEYKHNFKINNSINDDVFISTLLTKSNDIIINDNKKIENKLSYSIYLGNQINYNLNDTSNMYLKTELLFNKKEFIFHTNIERNRKLKFLLDNSELILSMGYNKFFNNKYILNTEAKFITNFKNYKAIKLALGISF